MEKKSLSKLLKQLKKNKYGSDVLELCSQDLVSSNVQCIAEALLHNTQIAVLAFSGNQITDEGGFALAKLIGDNKTITEIDVSFNKLTDKSVTQMFNSIKTNQHFRSITLLGNECSAGLENEIQKLLTQRRTSASQAKLIPINNHILVASRQTSPNSSVSSNDIFSLSCSPEKHSSFETPPDKGILLKKPSSSSSLLLPSTDLPLEDSNEERFNETLNGLVRHYTELKELKGNVTAKKQSTEAECNTLQSRINDLRALLQQLENEANAERTSIKKWKSVKQTEMKKAYPIDLTNIVYGEQIERGGSSATVFSSRVDGWKCAMKVIDLSQCSVSEEQSFRREIALLERLPFHPNICRYLFHLDLGNKQLGLFTTLYDITLRNMLSDSTTPLSTPTICKYALDIAEGLEFLHSQEIIHRDIKTENIFASVSFSKEKKNEGKIANLVITDFDTARKLKPNERTQTFIGSPYFMAPEIFAQEQPYTYSADIYSFGMVLYEIVTLQIPQQGVAFNTTAGTMTKGAKPDLSGYRNQYEEFVWLYDQCTLTEPSKRPNAPQIKRWLRRYLKNDCLNPTYEFVDGEFSPPGSFGYNVEPNIEIETRRDSSEDPPENAIELFKMLTQISSGATSPIEEPPEDELDEESVVPFVDSTDIQPKVRPISSNRSPKQGLFKFKPNHSSIANLCAPVVGQTSKFKIPLLVQAVKTGDASLTRSQLSLLHQKWSGKKGLESREGVFATQIDPLSRSTMLHHSVQKGSFVITKLLLDAGASPLVTNVNGDIPFHYFATHNLFEGKHSAEVNLQEIGVALSDGFRLIDRVNDNGETPLHFAIDRLEGIEGGFVSSIKYLIDHGADVNSVSKKGADPLELAIGRDNREVIKLLLVHGKAEVRKKHFRQASQAANPALLQLLADSMGN